MEGIGGGGVGGREKKLKRRKPLFIACSRLRDGGEKSFSKKKCENRARAVERQGGIFPAATAPFCKSRVSYFALLILIRPTILSESLAQATQFRAKCLNLHGHRL